MRHLSLLIVFLAVPALILAQDVPDVLPPDSPAAPQPDAEEMMTLREGPGLAIANAYGLPAWEQVEQIQFTFNVKPAEKDEATVRAWTWNVKTGEVTLRRDEQPLTFQHPLPPDAASPPEVVQADKQFVNDSYWFLFPFQIVWSNPTITEHGEAPLPIPQDRESMARKVTVQYPSEGGYTPGDAYDLYLDANDHIVQWVFRRGGRPAEEGRPATWEPPVQLGPILVSTEHWGPGEQFHLWFSDVRVTVRDDQGQEAVHEPTPLPTDDGQE